MLFWQYEKKKKLTYIILKTLLKFRPQHNERPRSVKVYVICVIHPVFVTWKCKFKHIWTIWMRCQHVVKVSSLCSCDFNPFGLSVVNIFKPLLIWQTFGHQPATKFLFWEPETSRRRGRPNKTLKDLIEEDIGLRADEIKRLM